VTDLPPEFAGLRERLLKLAERFAALPESVREKYADPQSRWRCVFCSIMGVSHVPIEALDGLMERYEPPSMATVVNLH
jgi:hypothetical protein